MATPRRHAERREPVNAMIWSDEVHAILTGDLTVAVSYCTPAGGAVVTAISPVGAVDRSRGTVSFTTSVGFGKKLEHILREPRVSLCYSTREHGFSSARSTVLVQGTAKVDLNPPPERLEALAPDVARFLGEPPSGRIWQWLLREYHERRVVVDVAVERLTAWPDLVAAGPRTVVGTPWPAPPASQSRPAKGAGPRVDVRALAATLSGLPHRLLAYRGADGFPVIIPVQLGASGPEGLHLVTPDGLVPEGARRAGLLAHRFGPQCSPLTVVTGTGWLEAAGATLRYSPHTVKSLSTPPSRFLQQVGNGVLAKYGYRRAQRNGQLQRLEALARSADVTGPPSPRPPAPQPTRRSTAR
jgi:hypothetical protein